MQKYPPYWLYRKEGTYHLLNGIEIVYAKILSVTLLTALEPVSSKALT